MKNILLSILTLFAFSGALALENTSVQPPEAEVCMIPEGCSVSGNYAVSLNKGVLSEGKDIEVLEELAGVKDGTGLKITTLFIFLDLVFIEIDALNVEAGREVLENIAALDSVLSVEVEGEVGPIGSVSGSN